MPGLINNPATIFYRIARASTLENWRCILLEANTYIEASCAAASGDPAAEAALDHDSILAWYNAIAGMAQEIVESRELAERILDPRLR